MRLREGSCFAQKFKVFIASLQNGPQWCLPLTLQQDLAM